MFPALNVQRFTHTLSIVIATFMPLVATAAPTLRCSIEQGGASHVLDFVPTSNPYESKGVNIGRHFRFKAVVIGSSREIDYIKLYTYYLTERQPILLHEAKYLAPLISPHESSQSLTGDVTLYSPNLGREVQYSCSLISLAP